MRTSNKILLGYIILIFLLPVLVLMSFNTKIKNGRYTVEKQQGQGSNFRSGSFKPYKVVKFIAPAGRVLQANLQHSDSLFYSYHQMGGLDSIKVYNTGDTLFVQFINPDKNYVEHLSVNLKLPSFDNLVIENAEVTLDSTSGSLNSDLLVEILGTGLLNIGKKKEHRVGPDDAAVIEFPYAINRLSVKMNEGEIALGGKANIKQLDMQVNGAGVVSINEGAAIGEVSGHLSEKSSVKANWKYVKKLAALATE
jgi:hypothetical protein